jgi:hypothetical protein
MKIEKSVVGVNGIVLAVGFLFMATSSYNSSTIGLLLILMAFLNIFLIIIYSILGNRNAMLNALILAGVLLTIGFSICSNSHGFN